ncbi:MAG: methyl-accepting chemotaxis protein [Thermodesulfobacteriota bacterium]|nr:methyl-accepting chemotaxis protein [Thermodesulfobacteriota bacterium]
MKLNVRSKFLLPVLCLTILGLTVLTATCYFNARAGLQKSINNELHQLVGGLASHLDSWVSRNMKDIQLWSREGTYQSALQQGMDGDVSKHLVTENLMHLKEQYGFYELLALLDAQGKTIAASDSAAIGISVADRDYFQQVQRKAVVVSDVVKSKLSGEPVFTIAAPVLIDNVFAGALLGVVDLSVFTNDFILPVTVGETGYAYVYAEDGMFVGHPDKSRVLADGLGNYSFGANMLGKENGIFDYTWEGESKRVAHQQISTTGWSVAAGAPHDEVFKDVYSLRNTSVVIGVLSAIVLSLVIWWLTGGIVIKPINRVLDFSRSLKAGDLSATINAGDDEFGQMAEALNAVAASLNAKAASAERIANGDLTCDVDVASDKDTLGKALRTMIDNLNEIVAELMSTASQVDAGASQVADSSQALSQGATEQASSLEETTSSMTQIGSQTKTNAENATHANQLTNRANEASQNGSTRMAAMMEAMARISEASKEIEKIIKTIDDIAFQTNLLALNAAVEAARAGKHGKGFAVVAQEVRSLAARSAKAVQETTALIEGSVKKVEEGDEIASQTAEALAEIKENVSKAADLVGEIAAASNEQAQAISQVSEGLSQIDGATQQNAANAEETSAASEELSSQSAYVRNLLSRFKLKTRTSRATAPDVVPVKNLSQKTAPTGRQQQVAAPQPAPKAEKAVSREKPGHEPAAVKPKEKPVPLKNKPMPNTDDADLSSTWGKPEKPQASRQKAAPMPPRASASGRPDADLDQPPSKPEDIISLEDDDFGKY